jgi:hypothetical protein
MRKLILLVVAVTFTLTQILAQESTFVKGDKVVSLGIGFGTGLYSGTGYTTTLPPLSGAFEIGVKDGIFEKGTIGVGGEIGYSGHKWEYSGWGWKYSNIIIGARGNLHYPLAKKLDTYTGLILGFNIVSTKEFGTAYPGYDYTASSSGLFVGWVVGGRYYFTDKFAGMVEVGVGLVYLNLGVALKF